MMAKLVRASGAACTALLVTAAVVGLSSQTAFAEATETRAARPARVTIAAVGDILFGRYIKGQWYRRVPKTDDPFSNVAGVLKGADIAFGNLETPVMKEPEKLITHRSLTFRAERSDVELLGAAGFDVLSIANNHTLNLGHAGAPITHENVAAAGLIPIGAGATLEEARAPAVIERDGLRIAFVARTVWTNGRKPVTEDGAVAKLSRSSLRTSLSDDVRQARADTKADFVIVSLHWGTEYEPHPEQYQRRTARAAIDAGADLVLGHHPHVVQDIERYHDGVIVYSMGNFLFDNPQRVQRETIIVTATLEQDADGRRISELSVHPVLIHRKTRVPELTNSRSWLRRLRRLAKKVRVVEPAPEAGDETVAARATQQR